MKINKPLFIVFEGIDGSGKTTLSEMLYKFFLENGISSVKDQEPTDGQWGKKIRNLLKNEAANANELLELFIKDREDDVANTILPSMQSGKIIIMDRYYFSNAAYQGAMGISPDFIIEKNREKKFPEPDRVYLIDIDPETALKRITNRNNGIKTEIFEKKYFLKKVRDIYYSITDHKFIILNGADTLKKNLKIIKTDINKNFFNNEIKH